MLKSRLVVAGVAVGPSAVVAFQRVTDTCRCSTKDPQLTIKVTVARPVRDRTSTTAVRHSDQSQNPGYVAHRPLSSSFLGLPYRIPNISHKKELL